MSSLSFYLDWLTCSAFGLRPRSGDTRVFPRNAKIAAVLYLLLPEVGIAGLLLFAPLGEQLTAIIFFWTLTAWALVSVIMNRLRLTVKPPLRASGRWHSILILSGFSFVDVGMLWQTTTGYFLALAIAAVIALLAFLITMKESTIGKRSKADSIQPIPNPAR